jgi:hypothetical protein
MSEEFIHLRNTCFYSFIIRTPFLKKYPFCPLSDKHFREINTFAGQRGAENNFSVIEQDINTMLKIYHNNSGEPPFDAEWFRRWIYTCCKPLAVVNNRNMFLLGCADTLFPLYYTALNEKIITLFK